jgi:hypothetical protein
VKLGSKAYQLMGFTHDLISNDVHYDPHREGAMIIYELT